MCEFTYVCIFIGIYVYVYIYIYIKHQYVGVSSELWSGVWVPLRTLSVNFLGSICS